MTNWIKISREELYKAVWSKPTTLVAKDYGISDSGIGKICKKMGIPKPKEGYWQKLKANKKVTIQELPPLTKDTVKFVQTISSGTIETVNVEKVEVCNKLINPHKLIQQTIVSYKKSVANSEGILNTSEVSLDIKATKKTFKRALTILDSLIKALEKRGYTVSIISSGIKFETVVNIFGQLVHFSIAERKKQVRSNSKISFVYSGKLKLINPRLYNSKEFIGDSKNSKIEDKLALFIGMLELFAKEQAEKEEKLIIEQREYNEKVLSLIMEKERRKLLFKLCKNNELVNKIRSLIILLENKPASNHASDFINWAKCYADKIDPTKINLEEILFNHTKIDTNKYYISYDGKLVRRRIY